MSRHPVYHTIIIVDVEGSSRRTDAERPILRTALYYAVAVALARAGVPWDVCQSEDRGDGIYLLIPATIPKSVLAHDFLLALERVLSDPGPTGQPWPRLRIGLHAGEVTKDLHGSSGHAVDFAFALTNADQARAALRADPTVAFSVVLSDQFHSALADKGVGQSRAQEPFHQIRFVTKTGRQSAWLRPVRPACGGLGPQLGQPSPSSGTPWLVGIGIPEGPVCGPGLLVSGGYVLTCAHLVPGGRMTPWGVEVVFSSLDRSSGQDRNRSRRAELTVWIDGSRDGKAAPLQDALVVLRVATGPPLDAAPAPLSRFDRPTPGRRLVAVGSLPTALEVLGPVRPSGPLVRLGVLGDNSALEGCGPGTPVTDGTTGTVLGIVVERTGWPTHDGLVMVPLEHVADRWLHLAQLLPGSAIGSTSTPAVGPELSPLDFSIALADLPILATPSSRDQVIATLGESQPDVGATVKRFGDRRLDLASLVRTCLQYCGAIEDLIKVLQGFEGNSNQMIKVVELLPRLQR